ncbi:MAG: DUF6273 domain-containing protein [Clostridiales bacterium]|nr:DUF6273 domain-containing protein [Clostridiales bacterium]
MRTPEFLTTIRTRREQQAKMKLIQQFKPTKVEKTPEQKVYVGNTIKINLPEFHDKVVKEVVFFSLDEKIALVNRGVVIGQNLGEVTILSQVTLEDKNHKLEYVQYETLVNVLVGTLKLKTYYSTKYHMNGEMILKERESTYLSRGKTARIVPALSYGIFSSISYVSSDEEIATVKNDGLIGLVKGKKVGTVTITATAMIGETSLTQSIVVDVKKPVIPVSNPMSGAEYTEEDDWKGDRVYFGSYEQDNKYWNGKEPILWRVLEVTRNSVLLLSEYGLESKNINDTFTDVTWETCTMRKWLNEDFLHKAFTNQEMSVIMNSTVHTPDNEEWGTIGGNDTIDKVFLLSVEEATNPKYGFYSDFKKKSVSRTVKNTKYATINDGYINKTNGNTCWWLRTRGFDNQFAYFFTNGSGTYTYFVGRRNDAVRPAIRVKLSDISFASNPKKGGYPYIVVN